MAKYVSADRLKDFLSLLKDKIPTKTSQLENDSNYPVDANYNHTDNNFTTTLKNKLDGIDSGANKYTLPAATKDKLGGVKIGRGLQVNADGTLSATGGGTADSVEWGGVLNTPTTLAGYGITDAKIEGNSITIGEETITPGTSNFSGSYNDLTNKPTKLSQFTNDKNFIDSTVDNLTNYYKKTEVTTLIGDIKTISIQKVEQLPTTGQSNVIYLVPANPSDESNHYIEYIWIAADNVFEPIGDTKIDLSNYWSKTELVEVTTEEISAMFTNW